MLEYLKNEANRTYTENGAVTHATTCSDCLDLFATIGALRSAEEQEILKRFVRAFTENPTLALKTLFFARDVRGGLGERKVFRICLQWLAVNAPASARKNLPYIAEFGRWDDLLCLMGTPCEKDALRLMKEQLEADLNAMDMGDEVSLLAKWLPSKAMFKYRKAFQRNDGERYEEFLSKVSRGEAVLHTGTLTPYEIIKPFFYERVSDQEAMAIDATWNAQEDFTGDENALVVIDGSGSMYSRTEPMPATVALSLGIYFAERNTGAFRNHFITFSENPQLVEIKGNTILDKVRYCHSYNEVANTNIQKVFELILSAAVRNHVPQSEMPATLYIISDMEFDWCTRGADMTNFEYAKKLFAEAGYQLPRVVFWNVQSRNAQQPVTQNEQGVALVSGCSPRIFSMLTSGMLSPLGYMLDILCAERYSVIAA